MAAIQFVPESGSSIEALVKLFEIRCRAELSQLAVANELAKYLKLYEHPNGLANFRRDVVQAAQAGGVTNASEKFDEAWVANNGNYVAVVAALADAVGRVFYAGADQAPEGPGA